MTRCRKRLAQLFVMLSILVPLHAHGVSASPNVVLLSQPNGYTFEARMRGDEYAQWMETHDGYTISKSGDEWFYSGLDINEKITVTAYSVGSLTASQLKNFTPGVHPKDSGPRETHTLRYIPTSHLRSPVTQKILVILVEFADQSLTYTAGDFEDLIFDADNSASTSVKDFFLETSYGKFTIEPVNESHGTSNDGVITVTLGTNHPNTDSSDIRAAVKAALTAADAYIDYSVYNSDSSTIMSVEELSVICIFAGGEASFTGTASPKVWGHKSSISFTTLDSVILSPYTAFGEIHGAGASAHIATIGIMCHELGHLMLGLPDLYDTNGGSEGIGRWGLMASGSWNRTSTAGDSPSMLSAWSRTKVGFSTPTSIDTSTSGTTIESAHALSDIKELWVDKYKSPFNIFSERFLVENRQQSGYDVGLPGNGLLIFHIDESQWSNTDENHKKVDLEEANNDGDMDNEVNRGDTGDPFPGSDNITRFDSTTFPNSNTYDDALTGIAVTNISASGPTMTADFASLSAGNTLHHDAVDYAYTGGIGNSITTIWTAVEYTNTGTVDILEGFEVYCNDSATIDVYFYASMDNDVPTAQIGTEEMGFAASFGWNRFILSSPLSFPLGSTLVMVLTITNDSATTPARFVFDDSPDDNSWYSETGLTSTYSHMTDLGGLPFDWQQHLLLNRSIIENLSTAWLDFAWLGIKEGTEPKPLSTFEETLDAIADNAIIMIKGDTGTAHTSWSGSIDSAVTLNAVNGTVTLGE